MKIPDFPSHSSAADNDLLLIYPAGTISTKQIKLVDLRAYLGTGIPDPPPPTPSNEVTLNYQFDGDTNGVGYYLGTNELTQVWTNPHASNALIVSLSAPYDSQHNNPHFLVDREINSLIATSNVANSFMSIDLRASRSLVINYYSIKGRNAQDHNLAQWKLQASNNNSDWIDIDTKLDSPLSGNQWLSIAVPDQTLAYRFFRILQTGSNTSGANILCIGEIELYGKLTFT